MFDIIFKFAAFLAFINPIILTIAGLEITNFDLSALIIAGFSLVLDKKRGT